MNGKPIELTDLIYLKKGFLSDEECQIIIDDFENSPAEAAQERCPHAFTGENILSTFTVKSPTFRKEAFNLVHKSIEKIICEYQDYLDTFEAFHVMRRLSLLYPHKYRIMKYEKGAWIHPHTDHDPCVYGSCTINLSDEYTGGEFSFWGGKHKIKLGKGDIMIWPADYFWVHEVEEIQSGTSYSVNCFIRSTPQSLPETVKYNVPCPDAFKPKPVEVPWESLTYM